VFIWHAEIKTKQNETWVTKTWVTKTWVTKTGNIMQKYIA